MTLERDRARRHTAQAVLRRIDDDTVHHLVEVAENPAAAPRRLAELDAEWDLDRAIEAEAATMGLLGLALGVFGKRGLLALPALVGASLLLYSTRGFYPLLPAFRRFGLRSAREIQRERYAIKALRGDFAELPAAPGAPKAAPRQPVHH